MSKVFQNGQQTVDSGGPRVEARVGKQQTRLDAPSRLFSGSTTVAGVSSPTRLPSRKCSNVTITAGDLLGPDPVYIGDSTVSNTNGYPLRESESITLHVGRLDTIYIWSADSSASVKWVVA